MCLCGGREGRGACPSQLCAKNNFLEGVSTGAHLSTDFTGLWIWPYGPAICKALLLCPCGQLSDFTTLFKSQLKRSTWEMRLEITIKRRSLAALRWEAPTSSSLAHAAGHMLQPGEALSGRCLTQPLSSC